MGNHPDSIRLNKAISESGYCSRRKADVLIEQGRVTLNGTPVSLGDRAMPGDQIHVDDQLITKKTTLVYIALNKPRGIVCTTDVETEKDNIVDYIGHEKRIFPIGRLDKPSEGLIFMTSDGDIVNKILRSRNNHEKVYEVRVNKPITKQFIDQMSKGIPILDTVTDPCKVEQMDRFYFKITLTQGLNRQIRKMCAYLNYEVYKLKRIKIMNIELDVPYGEWRYLNNEELREIHRLVKDSHKTFDSEI